MGPKLFAYVDRKGRPVVVTLLQLLLGCLAFINLDTSGGGNIFNWLLAFSGITPFFVFGSIALAHIRFRSAW
jgi:yeast amino acid transporter